MNLVIICSVNELLAMYREIITWTIKDLLWMDHKGKIPVNVSSKTKIFINENA